MRSEPGTAQTGAPQLPRPDTLLKEEAQEPPCDGRGGLWEKAHGSRQGGTAVSPLGLGEGGDKTRRCC